MGQANDDMDDWPTHKPAVQIDDAAVAAIYDSDQPTLEQLGVVFAWACGAAQMELVHFLQDVVERGAVHKAFVAAAKAGRVDVCEHLTDVLGLTRDDVAAHDHRALRKSARAGHLPVVQFLVDTFELSEADLRSRKDYALQWAAKGRHFEVRDYLEPRTRSRLDNAFFRVTTYGVEWSAHM